MATAPDRGDAHGLRRVLRRGWRIAILALATLAALAALAIPSAQVRATTAMPFQVRSDRVNGALRASIDGAIARSFDVVAPVLADPSHWCQFVPIDPAVRRCLFRESGAEDEAVLTLFGGREKRLARDTSFELPYVFEVLRRTPGSLEVSLRGDEGPGGSRDHRMWIRATRVGVDRTRLELTTSLTMGRALETVTRVYLATLGRHKFGFTVVGRGVEGEPTYVRGVRGLVERAAMRQLLAFEAHLDALDVPREERFATSLRHWWRSSQRHPQLAEPSRSEYLGEQRRDRRSQLRAQSARADGDRGEPRRATE